MRGVKILGLVERIESRIRSLRHAEVVRNKKVRLWMTYFTLLQTMSLSGTRWITYTVFGLMSLLSTSPALNTRILFTSLTILNIFMERLEIFLRYITTIASSFGCLRRIEIFLLLETKRDNRLIGTETALTFESSNDRFNEHELQILEEPKLNSRISGETFISMKDMSVGWTMEDVVLHGINLEIPQGAVTMIIGP
jgi:ATP-binding cassette subfamily C (CFTR/MRP) protein 1